MLTILRMIEGVLDVHEIGCNDEPLAELPRVETGELRRTGQRKIQLRRLALHANISDTPHETGFEVSSTEQVEQCRARIGIRYDDAGIDTLPALQFDTADAIAVGQDSGDGARGPNRHATSFPPHAAIAAVTAPHATGRHRQRCRACRRRDR